jgi:flavin reductase (DIM6/NTAB) family NADH-FMN oxidoreductase RutF
MMKKSIPIKPFWYSDILVLPKLVTIITTLNKEGIVNAAPYSLFIPYDVMNQRPQIMVGMRKFGHTYKNIVVTGEFVVNLPSAEFLDDIMETSRFYAEGVNELEHTRFTTIPSQVVSPPSLKECGQHIECRLHKNYEIDQTQAKVIADIVAIVVDEELELLDRGARIKRLNLPIYMGDEKRKYFYYDQVNAAQMLELQPPPKEEGYKTKLLWEDKALQALQKIPSSVRSMVVEMAEEIVQKEGTHTMTHERFMQMVREYAPKDVLERFEAN